MTRFITADGFTMWAAIAPDSRCDAPKVCDRRFPAYLAPFASEGDALAAIASAGGIVDLIPAEKKPARQRHGRR